MDNIDMKKQEEILCEISNDLKNINHEYVKTILNKNGWEVTARILGYEISEYDNLQLAGRMIIRNLKERIGTNLDNYLSKMEKRMNPHIYEYMKNHQTQLQEMIDKQEKNDIDYDWFSANSLIRTYLTKDGVDGKPCETPCQLWMRISVTLYANHGLDSIKEAFNQLCERYYIPASPTIFNAGLKTGQMSSCFLITVEDNIDSIYDRLKDQALVSKNNGAVGIDMSRLRDSAIGIDGKSNGIIPWIKLYNSSTRAVNQNGKRKGATTVFCRPHHINIFEFCEVALKSGDQYSRAHDVNIALWMPWLFWKRLSEDSDWTLFCPAHTKKLNDIWGFEWSKQYEEYEKDLTIPRKTVKARQLMDHIIDIQRKTGMPYILHSDSINMKCNQKNLGYIRSSNLCLEITEYSSSEEIPSCNLSSLSLRKFVKKPYNKDMNYSSLCDLVEQCYDFDKLGSITRRVVVNLNQVINENRYFDSKIKKSNDLHRPIGIGVSGFAEALHVLDIPYQDPTDVTKIYPVTKYLNKMIFACMYWNALAKSVDLAIEYGKYSSFDGSPASEGKLQFDLWKEEFEELNKNGYIDSRFRQYEDDIEVLPVLWKQKEYLLSNGDIIQPTWDDLKRTIKKYGLRNSLIIALMPTATSSQPLRNAETVEAHQSNIYSRKIMNGAYPVINRYMVNDLKKLGLWERSTIDYIQANSGSITSLDKFVNAYPDKYPNYKNTIQNRERLEWVISKYQTMWELSMKIFMQMAADRGRYVCQSQSLNIYLDDPSDEQLIAVHTFGNHIGLKTGMYYLREKAARDPIKFTVDPEILNFGSILNSVEAEVTPTASNYKIKNRNVEEIKNLKMKTKKNFICNDEICVACQ